MKNFTRIVAIALVLVMTVAVFASCAQNAKGYDKAKKALANAGYVVESDAGEWGSQVNDLQGVIYAYKIREGTENDKNPKASGGIVIYYFKSEKAANRAWDKTIKNDYESAKKRAAKEEMELISKREGKVVYYGTQDAIDIAFN